MKYSENSISQKIIKIVYHIGLDQLFLVFHVHTPSMGYAKLISVVKKSLITTLNHIMTNFNVTKIKIWLVLVG